MLNFKIEELLLAIYSCDTLKEFLSTYRSMYYFINRNNLAYLYDGIYFYDKEGVVNTCKELYGDKYDLTEFLNDGKKYSTKCNYNIPIICKKHGKISISINDLLSGVGCNKCIRDRRNDIRFVFNRNKIMYKEDDRRLNNEDIVNKIKLLYNNTIFVSNIVDYKNISDKMSFTCKYHGEFSHKLRSILKGSGCPYCNLIKKVSLILSSNKVINEIKDGIVYLNDGRTIGISGCSINLFLEDNVYDILSSYGIIYDDSKIKERWKSLDGFPKYKISTLGRVKNLETGRFINGHNMNKSGYIQKMITLYDADNKLHGMLLHRLVYKVFKGDIDSSISIDHIDGNFLNNRLSNLRACNGIKDNINNEITILSAKINAYNRNMEKKEVIKHNYDISSLDGEEWVDIIGMEDLYEVSNLGRIRSKAMVIYYNRNKKDIQSIKKPKMLKQHIKSGYMFISLGKNDKRIHSSVHKIVYESFNGKLADGLEIDHINGDKKDNRLCNLQALSHDENLAKRDYKKNSINNMFFENYDKTIPDVKNILNMKNKGLNISLGSLKKWKKENGIGRWHSTKTKK